MLQQCMSELPERLNNHLIAVSLLAVGYTGFEWYKGGGIVWGLLFGLFGYWLLAGIWQAWVHRRK